MRKYVILKSPECAAQSGDFGHTLGFKEHFVKIMIVDILTPTKLDFTLNPKKLALTRVGGI